MKKQLPNGLNLEVIELPIPILRHSKWLAVGFPPSIKEDSLLRLLTTSLKTVKQYAQEQQVKQIKIATNPSWKELVNVGLTPATHCMALETSALIAVPTKNYDILEITEPLVIKNLITSQFIYHSRYKPDYFTQRISKSVNWFIRLVKNKITKQEGFLLGAKSQKRFVGFLYAEYDLSEGCVDELFIEEKFRGRGYGKALLMSAGKKFAERKIPIITLFVGIDEKSLGFYEKLGFRKEFTNWTINLG